MAELGRHCALPHPLETLFELPVNGLCAPDANTEGCMWSVGSDAHVEAGENIGAAKIPEARVDEISNTDSC